MAPALVELGRGGRSSLWGSEDLVARHIGKEQHTGQAVEGMQSPAEDSFGGDVCEARESRDGERLMFGGRSDITMMTFFVLGAARSTTFSR